MEIQWSLLLFTVLAGAGSWIFVGVAVSEFTGKGKSVSFLASIVSVIIMIIGGLCSVTHLSHPTRMLGAISHPTSGIAVEAFMLGFTCIAILIYVILLKRGAAEGARKTFAVIGAILGILFSFLMGESYMMAAREAWNNVVVPLEYAVTSMVFGVSLFLLILAIRKEGKAAAYYGLPLLGACAISLVVGIIYGVYSGVVSDIALFWGCVVVIGVGVPAVCAILLMQKNKAKAAVAEAAQPATEAAETEESKEAESKEAVEENSEQSSVEDKAVAQQPADAGEANDSSIMGLTICASAGGLVGSVVFRMLMWASGVGLYTFFGGLS